MRRIFKVILAVFAVFIILFAVFAALIFGDLAAYTATSSKTLQYTGEFMGTALVLYDPGLTGVSSKVAQQIADELYNQSLTVTLAGIKSSAAAKTTGYDIIVIGGPIYAGAPTVSVKDALSSLKHDADARVGVYGIGQGASAPEDIAGMKAAVPALQNGGALSNTVVVKIGESENLTQRAEDFVKELLK
jgi:flavodoxin